MPQKRGIVKFSWKDIEKLTEKLAVKIKADKFKPDYIIGIAIGGLVPLCLLAKELQVNNVVTVTARSYNKQRRGQINISYLPSINLKGKKILLVDEIADTGETLKKISKIFVSRYKAEELKTAVLGVKKLKCKIKPDFFVFEKTGWVVFPWEKKEFPEYF